MIRRKGAIVGGTKIDSIEYSAGASRYPQVLFGVLSRSLHKLHTHQVAKMGDPHREAEGA